MLREAPYKSLDKGLCKHLIGSDFVGALVFLSSKVVENILSVL